jgi:hypothetical protein
VPLGPFVLDKETAMTMLFDPVRLPALTASHRFRAAGRAIVDAGARTIEAISRLSHDFVVNLLRRYVRQALHSGSDRRFTR